MDMKNTTILLMLLLCILGLMAGVHFTEDGQSAASLDGYDEVVHEDSNGTITISLELNEKNESDLVNVLHEKIMNG